MNNTESITQLAIKAIDDFDYNVEEYSTAEAVLDYLQDETNFKTLDVQIKETMIKVGVCSEDSETSEFVDVLYKKYETQHPEWEQSEKTNKRKTIREWLSGKTKSISSRTNAIELCFMLNLNLELATEFLNKCGFNQLNVRDVCDATYLYCILKGNSWNAAQKIISEYNSNMTTLCISAAEDSISHTGNTTILLQNEILNHSNWENDEQFLNTFLLPNKERFLGYSLTAAYEYYRLKNSLFTMFLIKEVLSLEYSSDIESAIKELRKMPDHILSVNCETLSRKSVVEKDILIEISQLIDVYTDIYSQKKIAEFLNSIITNERFLKDIITSIADCVTERIRKYGDSDLKNTVMNAFPRANTFANFEKTPGSVFQNLATRKAVVLMYFIRYSYNFSCSLPEIDYYSEEFGLDAFMDGLNQLLEKCGFSKLYPANQFDWLILKCIRSFELGEIDIEDDVLDFFNEVISFSFGAVDDE